MTVQSLKDRLLAMNLVGNFARFLEMSDIRNALTKLENSAEYLNSVDAFVQYHIQLSSEGQARTNEELQAMTTTLQGIYQQHQAQLDAELQQLSQRIDALEGI